MFSSVVLPAPGRSHDRDELALLHLEVDFTEHVGQSLADLKVLFDVLELYHGDASCYGSHSFACHACFVLVARHRLREQHLIRSAARTMGSMRVARRAGT